MKIAAPIVVVVLTLSTGLMSCGQGQPSAVKISTAPSPQAKMAALNIPAPEEGVLLDSAISSVEPQVYDWVYQQDSVWVEEYFPPDDPYELQQPFTAQNLSAQRLANCGLPFLFLPKMAFYQICLREGTYFGYYIRRIWW